MNPPNKNTTSNPADPNVLAMIISRARDAIIRNRPNAIWCIEKSRNIKRKNLQKFSADGENEENINKNLNDGVAKQEIPPRIRCKTDCVVYNTRPYDSFND